MASIEMLAATLRSLAKSGMKPTELLSAMREKHGEASMKEIVRAAFYALIEDREPDSASMRELRAFALRECGAGEDHRRPVVDMVKWRTHRRNKRVSEYAR